MNNIKKNKVTLWPFAHRLYRKYAGRTVMIITIANDNDFNLRGQRWLFGLISLLQDLEDAGLLRWHNNDLDTLYQRVEFADPLIVVEKVFSGDLIIRD